MFILLESTTTSRNHSIYHAGRSDYKDQYYDLHLFSYNFASFFCDYSVRKLILPNLDPFTTHEKLQQQIPLNTDPFVPHPLLLRFEDTKVRMKKRCH